MTMRYESWYADVTSRKGEMDREFFGTLAMTLKYAIKYGHTASTVIGREYGDFRSDDLDTIGYPVFGVLYRLADGKHVYIGKIKPTDKADKTYRVYANGSLRPVKSQA